ncbi:methyltransferase domain-containing protein [Streptomyces sp. NPDC050842]|uniref:methyltransferase domain-containing protein n=1 Tax=Streptomyces sp. NPDC050842 TaxID=3365636 RepID=UPI003797CDE0
MEADLLGSGQARMNEAMDERGLWPDEDSPWIRRAMADLARQRFAPDTVWFWDGRAWVPVDRGAEPERWAALVYPEPEQATVTQVTGGLPTSSLSCVSVVADMLDSLMLEPGHEALDLGTGTGWNAALLAHQVGQGGRVVSVEADACLAEAAARRLGQAGLDVDVRTGDGSAGAPDRGPYDRLIATYSVETVPWAWIEQLRPGGRMVFPWGRLGHYALTVADDGKSATGWLQGLALFMGDRRTPAQSSPPPALVLDGGDEATDEELFSDLVDDGHVLFALRVSHPHIVVSVDRTGAEPRVELRDAAGRSASAERNGGRMITVSGDGQELWTALRPGHQLWRERGRPQQWDFGMTVTPGGQTVWSHTPDNGPYTGR